MKFKEAGLDVMESKPCMDQNCIIDGIKVLCQCQGIKKQTILKHIASGVKTVAEMQRATGAGSGSCRGKQCTPRIEELLQAGLRLDD